jgi:hypothetical protein
VASRDRRRHELDQATLTAQDRPALRAEGISVRGDLDLTDGYTTNRTTDLRSAAIGGRLTIADASLDSDQQPTVSLSAAHLDTLRLGALHGRNVAVDLRRAAVTTLQDDPTNWPPQLWLDQLTYDALHPHLPPSRRLAWLQRDPEFHHPHPYQQLAAQYRRIGQDQDARTVLLAKHRSRRRQLHPAARLWGYLQDAAVGYGYRPARALGWLTLLAAILTTYTAVRPPLPTSNSSPSFNPLIYAIDVLLPILNLGQQNSYTPVGAGRWITWLVTLCGWVLASAVVTAVTRTITRE